MTLEDLIRKRAHVQKQIKDIALITFYTVRKFFDNEELVQKRPQDAKLLSIFRKELLELYNNPTYAFDLGRAFEYKLRNNRLETHDLKPCLATCIRELKSLGQKHITLSVQINDKIKRKQKIIEREQTKISKYT